MFLQYTWFAVILTAVNITLSIVIITKLKKQEKFQTSEAHANLQLINQSLNRLSEIAERFEQNNPIQSQDIHYKREAGPNRINQTTEQKALTMIRQGEDPRAVGRKLGISRSEIDLLVASEKLGCGH